MFGLFRIYSSTGVLNHGITTKKQYFRCQTEPAHQNAGVSHFGLPHVSSSAVSCCAAGPEMKRHVPGLGGGAWKGEERLGGCASCCHSWWLFLQVTESI